LEKTELVSKQLTMPLIFPLSILTLIYIQYFNILNTYNTYNTVNGKAKRVSDYDCSSNELLIDTTLPPLMLLSYISKLFYSS